MLFWAVTAEFCNATNPAFVLPMNWELRICGRGIATKDKSDARLGDAGSSAVVIECASIDHGRRTLSKIQAVSGLHRIELAGSGGQAGGLALVIPSTNTPSPRVPSVLMFWTFTDEPRTDNPRPWLP